MIIISNNGKKPELIKTKGFPLGMVDSAQFKSRIELAQRNLDDGGWLIQYTDGINEGQDSQNREFGMSRFIDEIQRFRTKKPAELVSGVLKAHHDFVAGAPQYDDITLLAMKWTGRGTDNLNKEYLSLHEQS